MFPKQKENRKSHLALPNFQLCLEKGRNGCPPLSVGPLTPATDLYTGVSGHKGIQQMFVSVYCVPELSEHI